MFINYRLETATFSDICIMENNSSVIFRLQVPEIFGLRVRVSRKRTWLRCNEGKRMKVDFRRFPNRIQLEWPCCTRVAPVRLYCTPLYEVEVFHCLVVIVTGVTNAGRRGDVVNRSRTAEDS